jgi:hypothetical protein
MPINLTKYFPARPVWGFAFLSGNVKNPANPVNPV